MLFDAAVAFVAAEDGGLGLGGVEDGVGDGGAGGVGDEVRVARGAGEGSGEGGLADIAKGRLKEVIESWKCKKVRCRSFQSMEWFTRNPNTAARAQNTFHLPSCFLYRYNSIWPDHLSLRGSVSSSGLHHICFKRCRIQGLDV